MIGLFVFHSPLDNREVIIDHVSPFYSKLPENRYKLLGYYDNNAALNKELKKIHSDFAGYIILPATGGTEVLIKTLYDKIKAPSLICAIPTKNSLASSLEAYAVVKDNHPSRLIYTANPDDAKHQVERFIHAAEALLKINNMTMGVIGEPSDWLLTSKVNHFPGNFKTKISYIDTKELIDEVGNIEQNHIPETAEEIKSAYGEVKVKDNAIHSAVKVHRAIKNLIQKNKLDTVTIRCFDLLKYKITSCLAVSMLNDEKIVAGCESDLQSTFTMMVINALFDEAVWMANPSEIDLENNSITLAHCTIPSIMLTGKEDASITTHMESGLSCAIQGQLRNEKVTILRIGGRLDKILVAKGEIIPIEEHNPSFCRTQAKISISGDLKTWISKSLGNHQILVYGDRTELIKEFCEIAGIETIFI